MVAIPFATQSFPSDSRPLTSERLVNLFAEIQPETAKSRLLVRPTPGMVGLYELPDAPVRAMIEQRTELYAVAGNGLYRIATGGAVSLVGSFDPGADTVNVSMATSSSQVAVCCPPWLYVWNSQTSAFSRTGGDLPAVSSVAFVDGFFVATEDGSGGRFWVSDAYNASVFQPLSFATTESNPDFLVRAIALRSEVWLLGNRSTEVWNSTGGSFPFERNSGATFRRGCRARRSVAIGDNSVFWIGDDLMVYRSQGYSPVRISTWALEQILARAGNVSNAVGFCINYAGHVQYVITFGLTKQTWVYDVPSGLWSERTSGTNHWRGECAERFGPNQLIGDTLSGKIFRMDTTVNTEDGVSIIRTAVLPPIFAEGRRAFMSRLELLMETGTGTGSLVTLEISDNGGRTFRSFPSTDTGAPGAYSKRLIWNRLGSFRERTLRFTFQGDARPSIFGCSADLSQGAS